MRSASERTSGQASGPVLSSRFQEVLNHSAIFEQKVKCFHQAIAKDVKSDLAEANRKLEDFYVVEKIPLEVKQHADEEDGKKGSEEGKGKGKGKGGKGGKGEKGKSPKKNVTVTEEKDVVYVKDIVSFVNFIIQERGLDPAKTVVRIGLDGGQETFKIIASIFEDGGDDDDDDDGDDDDEDGHSSSDKGIDMKKPDRREKLNTG